jgi:hypothetical protein
MKKYLFAFVFATLSVGIVYGVIKPSYLSSFETEIVNQLKNEGYVDVQFERVDIFRETINFQANRGGKSETLKFKVVKGNYFQVK